MEIQQHDGVVVDVAGLGRASPSFCETERCSRGGGRRPRLLCLLGNVAEIQNFLRITKINLWSNLATRGRSVQDH